VLNEVPWLKNIDKTPTIMVYSKRKNAFKVVETSRRKVKDENDTQEVKNEMIKAIEETIKEGFK
jgi:hypothetical protein